jgi:hypothetical protein
LRAAVTDLGAIAEACTGLREIACGEATEHYNAPQTKGRITGIVRLATNCVLLRRIVVEGHKPTAEETRAVGRIPGCRWISGKEWDDAQNQRFSKLWDVVS